MGGGRTAEGVAIYKRVNGKYVRQIPYKRKRNTNDGGEYIDPFERGFEDLEDIMEHFNEDWSGQKKIYDDSTGTEQRAIHEYLTPFKFEELQKTARTGNGTDENMELVRGLQAMINRTSSQENLIAYRSTSSANLAKMLGVSQEDLLQGKNINGKTYTDEGFTSTTLKRDSLYDDIGVKFDDFISNDVMLKIKIPKGSKVLFGDVIHGNYGNESALWEMLLQKGTKFKISSNKKFDNRPSRFDGTRSEIPYEREIEVEIVSQPDYGNMRVDGGHVKQPMSSYSGNDLRRVKGLRSVARADDSTPVRVTRKSLPKGLLKRRNS
ncbi:MAG: hypothetical protein IJI57_04560 [Flexilinea sp.]|nr:hypothetical protein [Flexilinea sp.]